MEIEITPKIADWLHSVLGKGLYPSEAKAIESLIDSDVDIETGLSKLALHNALQEGILSGTLSGDARHSISDIFASARERHSAT